jgi:predicted ATPase/class 3 adenylate cyclase
MADLPTGTVTFLFTDIEGSTRLWEQHPQAMAGALARHDAIMRQAIRAADGVVYKVIGDAFQVAFPTAPMACAAALAAQRGLTSEAWGVVGAVPVRMALHSCAAVPEDGDYRTGALNRLGRLLGVVHGGQIVLSRSTADLAYETLPPEVTLRDLGEHHLRDLRPEHLFQVVSPDLPADFPPLKSLDRRPHNLPVQPTALIGRENELVTICGLLHRADVRLVTLTGPGGTGKTRLGFQVAAELLDDFADGISFVNLAPISDPHLVAVAVTQTLGIKEQAGRMLLDSLKDWLREKQLLLLLDNFEQIVVAAPLVGELLASAPGLNVLATSRMPLHLSGEREFAVAPLGLPPRSIAPYRTASTAGGRTSENRTLDPTVAAVADLSQYAAVRLFIERAQAVKADFAVTNANALAVTEICYQLDGLPLAIELAAARVKLFPPQALLTRLSSRLTLLTAGARDLPARHQTIRTTIDWSYQLLDAGEQRLFACLGVFVGGWTLEAAAAVCNMDAKLGMDVVDGIAALLEQSLVRQSEELEGEPRFTMLETIREYALEQLVARGEAEAVQRQHAEFFLALAEEAEPQLFFTLRAHWLERLEHEYGNLRAALRWFTDQQAVETSLRLGGMLCSFWEVRGYLTEGRKWLAELLALAAAKPRTAERAKALLGAGNLASLQGDYVSAETLLTESLAIGREVGNQRGAAWSLASLGWVRHIQGDAAAAHRLLEESATIGREVGDTSVTAFALHSLAQVRERQGDLATARAYEEESLAIWRGLRDPRNMAFTLVVLGRLAFAQGDDAAARAWWNEGLAIAAEVRDPWCIGCFLGSFVALAVSQQQPVRALRLAVATDVVFQMVGTPLPLATGELVEHGRAQAMQVVDTNTQARARAEGQAMTLEQAVAYALEQALPEGGTVDSSA